MDAIEVFDGGDRIRVPVPLGRLILKGLRIPWPTPPPAEAERWGFEPRTDWCEVRLEREAGTFNFNTFNVWEEGGPRTHTTHWEWNYRRVFRRGEVAVVVEASAVDHSTPLPPYGGDPWGHVSIIFCRFNSP